jgi:endonuclease/exonuclease/phosphatase family metal-dependent hydrolase
MTMNFWHQDRPREMRVVSQHLRSDLARAPDFVLCQEIVFGRDDPLPNTAAVLAADLGYHWRGTKRTTDSEGVAILSRFPFDYYSERHLQSQTSRLLIGFRRVSVMGEFLVPSVGRVRVVNVHLTNWRFEHRIRNKQLRETLQWIAQRDAQVPATLTFLGGDFNAEITWPEMGQLLSSPPGAPGFQNFNSLSPTRGTPGSPDTRIDFVFVASRALAVRFVREQLLWPQGLFDGADHFYPSDHLAVVHDYRIIRAPSRPLPAITGITPAAAAVP